MFLLRPDDEVNNAYLYCLIEAAQKFDIVLLLSQMMSNHQHTPFYDPKGLANEFTHRFHTNLAKCMNVYRGRWENFWSSDEPSLVELVDIDIVVEKLIYTATNPVKDGLVEKLHQWPGPKLVQAFLTGKMLKASRPRFLFRKDGPMPEQVEMTLTIPTELGNHHDIVERVRAGIAAVEQECLQERAKNNRRVLGRRRILRQPWRGSPTTVEPRRKLRPRVAASNKDTRIKILERNKEFQIRYREARSLWLAGTPIGFPAGTYWLRRFANVPIEPTI
jgi:hypothetical protein